MKKLFLMLGVVSFVVLMTACGGTKQEESVDTCCNEQDSVEVVDTVAVDTTATDVAVAEEVTTTQKTKTPKVNVVSTAQGANKVETTPMVQTTPGNVNAGRVVGVTTETESAMGTAVTNTREAVDKMTEEQKKKERKNWKESRKN